MLVRMFHAYRYLSSSMSFFHIPKSFGNVTEPATLVYDWRYLSGRHDLADGAQIPEDAFLIL
jgi:hypothetical protein